MTSSRVISSLLLIIVAVSVVSPAQKRASEKSLYQRLGGYDKIAAITKDFADRFDKDPLLNPFAVGFSSDSGKRQIQLFTEFFCEQTGGPCTYVGRSMTTAHEGLTITESHWNSFMSHFGAALDAAKVPAREKTEVLEIFAKLKPQIGVK